MPASNSLEGPRGLHEVRLAKAARGQLESNGQAFFCNAAGQRDSWGSSHIERLYEPLQSENQLRLRAKGTPRLIFPRGQVQILGRVTEVASPL